MKTIARLLTILLAAFMVVGATWAVGQSSGNTNAFAGRGRPEFSQQEGQRAFPDREFGERGERDGAQLFNARGWFGFTQTVVPIALIIAVVALPMNFWKRRQRARRNEASALPA